MLIIYVLSVKYICRISICLSGCSIFIQHIEWHNCSVETNGNLESLLGPTLGFKAIPRKID